MIAQFNIHEQSYVADLSKPISIAIPLNFGGKQPNTYDVPIAQSRSYEDGAFVGDVRRGGSCNFETIEMTPHCNGTHTECIGHITRDRVHIAETKFERISTALLITLEPKKASTQDESYNHTLENDDMLITRKSLESELNKFDFLDFSSLIIRTKPNNDSKLTDNYQLIPPYFTKEAMEYISEIKINSLLVDLPSIDRLYDEGLMVNHRIFWQVNEKREMNLGTAHKTVTEFIYVTDPIADGYYLLNLQIPPFLSDAAPSTPLLYKLEKQ